MRLALVIAGVVLILVGAVWIGQGTGYFPYPASSFMIDDSKWAYADAATLMVGFLLVTLSRRC
jgi:hypothetical protein